jgi:hypothetical protein
MSEYIEGQLILYNLRNAYSPCLTEFNGQRRLFIGGWLTEADVGPDKMYMSVLSGNDWLWPTVNFTKPGYHVNDPSIVQRSKVWLMYYTALSNADAQSGNIYRNVTGLAISSNGGLSWCDLDILIPMDNGYNEFGAWSPSAIAVGEEIWVYFHTNEAACKILRARFDVSGMEQIGDTELVDIPPYISNVDVSVFRGQFMLVANGQDIHSLRRFVSDDGLTFTETPPLIAQNIYYEATPHVEILDEDTYKVYFGWSTSDLLHFTAVCAYTFAEE